MYDMVYYDELFLVITLCINVYRYRTERPEKVIII